MYAYIVNDLVFMGNVSVFHDFAKMFLMNDNKSIKYKGGNKMKKAMANFMDTYGKYLAASAFALKPCTKTELQYMAELFRNDSQR